MKYNFLSYLLPSCSTKQLAVCVVLSTGLVGCQATSQEQVFGKSVADASAALASDVTLLSRINSESQLTDSTAKELVKKPDKTDIAKMLKGVDPANDPLCATNDDQELKVAQNRAATFQVITKYVQTLDAALNNHDFSSKLTELSSSADDTIKSLSSDVPGGASAQIKLLQSFTDPAITLISKIASGVETEQDIAQVRKLAKKMQPQLDSVVQEIDTGLVSLDPDLTHKVNLWGECERELRQIVYANGSSAAEMTAMIAADNAKMVSLKAQLGVSLNTKGLIDKLPRQNEQIYKQLTVKSPTSIDDARAIVTEAGNDIATFKAALASGKKL